MPGYGTTETPAAAADPSAASNATDSETESETVEGKPMHEKDRADDAVVKVFKPFRPPMVLGDELRKIKYRTYQYALRDQDKGRLRKVKDVDVNILAHWLARVMWALVMQPPSGKDFHLCYYCGAPLSLFDGKDFRKGDHDDKIEHMSFDRLDNGVGHHRLDNLILTCGPCNTARGTLPWRVFYAARIVSSGGGGVDSEDWHLGDSTEEKTIAISVKAPTVKSVADMRKPGGLEESGDKGRRLVAIGYDSMKQMKDVDDARSSLVKSSTAKPIRGLALSIFCLEAALNDPTSPPSETEQTALRTKILQLNGSLLVRDGDFYGELSQCDAEAKNAGPGETAEQLQRVAQILWNRGSKECLSEDDKKLFVRQRSIVNLDIIDQAALDAAKSYLQHVRVDTAKRNETEKRLDEMGMRLAELKARVHENNIQDEEAKRYFASFELLEADEMTPLGAAAAKKATPKPGAKEDGKTK